MNQGPDGNGVMMGGRFPTMSNSAAGVVPPRKDSPTEIRMINHEWIPEFVILSTYKNPDGGRTPSSAMLREVRAPRPHKTGSFAKLRMTDFSARSRIRTILVICG